MEKISYVVCPACKREFYLEGSDYFGKPDAPCHCPFCAHQFAARQGNPRPPLGRDADSR